MKTLLIICSFLLVGIFSPAYATNGPANTGDPVKVVTEDLVKIKVTVDVGRKKKDCTGFGVCSITVEAGLRINSASESGGSGYAENVKGGLQVDLFKSSMTVENMAKNFRYNTFRVDEDFVLSKQLMSQLRLRSGVIKKGVYYVEDKGDCLRILFN